MNKNESKANESDAKNVGSVNREDLKGMVRIKIKVLVLNKSRIGRILQGINRRKGHKGLQGVRKEEK